MTDQAIRPTYEQLVEALPTEARNLVRDGDRWAQYQRETLSSIADDEALSDEGRRAKAQELIDRNAPKVSESYRAAREKTEAAVESSWKFSVPMPGDGATLATVQPKDASELLAVQHEADSLARRIEGKSIQELTRERSHAGGNDGVKEAGSSTLPALRAAFDEAMACSGVEAKVRALAVQRGADAAGIPLDEVAGHHRRPVHERALADAQRYESSKSVLQSGRGIDQNPFEAPRSGAKGVGSYGSGNKAMLSSGRQQLFPQKHRKPQWK